MKNNIFYAQSGGVTPVINATACGVIETARQDILQQELLDHVDINCPIQIKTWSLFINYSKLLKSMI